MINCNLVILSFLAFMAMWIMAFADDASGMQMAAHKTAAVPICGQRVVAQR